LIQELLRPARLDATQIYPSVAITQLCEVTPAAIRAAG